MTKEIQLAQGEVALVDDEDFEWLNQYRWHINDSGYAVRNVSKKIAKNKTVRMHREIMNTPFDLETDHINGNRLDNRKTNLRICTSAQNKKNAKKRTDNTSGYKGVDWDKINGKWRAKILVNGKQITIGRFANIDDAAHAYDEVAEKQYGEFASLNFPR
jgi:hypothetical protein